MTPLLSIPHKLDRASLTCRAIIETPRGCRSKFDYDPETGLFLLDKRLPEGMSFPLDFGFIPSTKAEDGDPLDILVLYEEPIPVGMLLEVRLIGVIEGEQYEDGPVFRNDRLIGVATASRLHQDISEVGQLPKSFTDQLSHFWIVYNERQGRTFDFKGLHGPSQAADLLEKAAITADPEAEKNPA